MTLLKLPGRSTNGPEQNGLGGKIKLLALFATFLAPMLGCKSKFHRKIMPHCSRRLTPDHRVWVDACIEHDKTKATKPQTSCSEAAKKLFCPQREMCLENTEALVREWHPCSEVEIQRV